MRVPKPPTKIRRVRFSAETTFTPDRMVQFGNVLVNAMKQRMFAGRDASDAVAPPLSAKYATRKARVAPPAIRNMRFTGQTLRGLQVLRATDGQSVVGIADPVSIRRFNWQRYRFWGVSPSDRAALQRESGQILSGKIVSIIKIA